MDDSTHQTTEQQPRTSLDRHAAVEEILSPVQPILDAIDAREHEEYVRGSKALALAPSLTLYRALLRGERLPWNVLDYFAAERYGLRRRHADARYGLDDFNDVPRNGP